MSLVVRWYPQIWTTGHRKTGLILFPFSSNFSSPFWYLECPEPEQLKRCHNRVRLFLYATVWLPFLLDQSIILCIQVTWMAFMKHEITMHPWLVSGQILTKLWWLNYNTHHGRACTCTSNRWQVTCKSNRRDCWLADQIILVLASC